MDTAERYTRYKEWIKDLESTRLYEDYEFQRDHTLQLKAFWILSSSIQCVRESKTTTPTSENPMDDLVKEPNIAYWREWLNPLLLTSTKAAEPTTSHLTLTEKEFEWAFRFARWDFYLKPWVKEDYRRPPSKEVQGAALLMKDQMFHFLKKVQLDPFYDLGVDYVKASHCYLGAELAYLETHPDDRGFSNTTNYLNTDLTTVERVTLNSQATLFPHKHGEWEQMNPLTQEMWIMAAWAYRFNQSVNKSDTDDMKELTQTWQEHFWVPWWELGTEAGDHKLKLKTLFGNKARPIVVHLGCNAWMVRKRHCTDEDGEAEQEWIFTKSVLEALCQWCAWVRQDPDFEGVLENGTPCPKIFIPKPGTFAPRV